MIDQFVGFCLHRRVAIIILAVLLSAFGVYAWETLSVEAYPELGDVAAQVTTQMPGPRRGRSRAAHHRAPGARDQRHSGAALDALLEHLRAVADHRAVPRRLRGLLGAPAADRTHQSGGAACGRDPIARSRGGAGRRDLPLHPGVQHARISRSCRKSSAGRDPGAQVRSGRGRRHQFRRLHHGVPARSRPEAAGALRPRHHRRDQRHQQQQHQCRRRPGVARRSKLRDPRRRPDP